MSNKKFKNLFILILTLIAAGILLYAEAITNIVSAVLNREGSSHGLFVPFLSAYFLWTRQRALAVATPAYDLRGLLIVAAGLLPAVIPGLSPGTQFLGFIAFAAGLVWTLFGKPVFKIAVFPIFFLITMVPIPTDLYQGMANLTRHISFGGSLMLISMLGISYVKTGWVIELSNTTLVVAMSCSGIRYLISYFVFGLAYAYLEKETRTSRVTTVLMTIPISLFASVMRLTAIFVMTQLFGPVWGEPRPHIFISWTVFFIILILTISIDQFFSNRKHKKSLMPNVKPSLESSSAN